MDREYGCVMYTSRDEPGYFGQRIRLCSVYINTDPGMSCATEKSS